MINKMEAKVTYNPNKSGGGYLKSISKLWGAKQPQVEIVSDHVLVEILQNSDNKTAKN